MRKRVRKLFAAITANEEIMDILNFPFRGFGSITRHNCNQFL